MNKTYRLIWNELTRTWIAVSETAKARGKRSGTCLLLSSFLLGVACDVTFAQAPAPNTLPTGSQVVAGTASIAQSGATMNITQSTQRAAIDWQTFNVGSAATVNFLQPSSSAVTLNRVLDSNPSQIFGRITAPGQVFLVNPNGVYFAPGASVDVGALVASTHGISNDDFMAGNYRFSRNGATGSVVNEGELKASLGGYIALLAPEVRNQGVVIAQAGTVAMASGETITLKMSGSNTLADIEVTPSAIAALVENGNAVHAPGGLVILSAQAANSLQGGVVRNSGSIEAKGLVDRGGIIRLEGDNITLASSSKLDASGATGGGEVLVGGNWQGGGGMYQATTVTMEQGALIDVSATKVGAGGTAVLWSDITNPNSVTTVRGTILAKGGAESGNGGRIETSGHTADIGGATVSASAPAGTGGLWLIDPTDATIDQTAANSYAATLNGGTSVLNEVTGDITWNSGVTLLKDNGGDATLTLKATGSIAFQANGSSTDSIKSTSDKLNTILWADSDGSGAGRVAIAANNNITTNGGNLVMAGGADNGSNGGASGDDIPDGYARGYAGNVIGVDLATGATLTTGGGYMLLRGQGHTGGIGVSNYATLSTGSGSFTATGSSDTYGVFFGTAGNLTTTSGNVALSGTSSASMGVMLQGVGASGTDTITTGSGTIDVTGSGSVAGFGGIYVESARLLSTSGAITLDGTNANSGGWGIKLDGGHATLGYKSGGSSSSNLLLKTDSININAGRLASSGTLTIETKTSNTAMTIGGTISANTFTLSTTNLSTHFINGFSSITIGSTSAGDINFGATALTYNDTLIAKTAGNITLPNSGSITGGSSENASLVLWSDADASSGGYVKLASTAATSTDIIKTNGGHLWIGGSNTNGGSTTWNGLTVGDGFAKGTSTYATGVYLGTGTISTGGGNIAIYGQTSTSGTAANQPDGGSPNHSGIYTAYTNGAARVASLNSGTGTLLMHGKILATDTSQFANEGMYLNGVTLRSAATSGDAITLIGDASGATAVNTSRSGITAVGWNNQPIDISATGGGNINVQGTSVSGSGYSLSYGVRFVSAGSTTALSTTGGTGNISITGTVGDSAADYSVGFTATTDSISSTGNLTITGTSNNGNNKPIMLAGPVTVAGTTSLTASGQNITATNASNNFTGAVSVVSGNNVSLRDTNAMELGASTVSGTLTLQTGGALTQSGDLSVTGTTSITAGSGNIVTLDRSGNNFTGAVSVVSGNNVSLRDTNALELGASTVSGTLTLQTSGALTQSGDLAVTGTTSISAGSGNNVTLDRSGNDFTGAVAVASGNDVSLRDTNALLLGTSVVSGNLTLQTGGALTQSGDLAVTGTTSITAGSGNNVSLDRSGNNFTGAVAVASGNDVSLRDTNALLLGTSVVSGNLTLQTAGAITQSTGTTLTVTGTTGITAGSANDITLNKNNNFTGAVSVVSGNNVALTDANALVLGASTISGTLDVSTFGAVTQTGAMTVAGLTTLGVLGGNDITLTEAANNFSAVYASSARNVSLRDAGALILSKTNSNMNLTGTLAVEVGGDLTQTGRLTVAGTTDITAGANNVNLSTATSNAFTGGVRFVSANNVDIKQQQSNVNLVLGNANGASSITGNLNVDTTGLSGITQAGALSVGGTTTLKTSTTSSHNSYITLDNTSNDFTGAVTVTAAKNVTLVDSNALTLGAITSAGTLDIATLTGNLALSGAISTTDTSSSAIVLNAGKNTAAETTTGGDILVSGGSVSTGSGGIAKLYSGSTGNSTGLTTLIGSGSGRFRYASDETTTNYTASLTSGSYAIFRESPSITVQPDAYTSAYGTTPAPTSYAISAGSAQNGDSLSGTISATINSTATAASTPGTYNLTIAGLPARNSVGYALTGAANAGGHTVTKAPLTVTASNASKTSDGQAYSGSQSVSYSGFVNGETSTVLGGTLAYGGTWQGATGAGSYTIVPSGLTSSNYSFTYVNGTLSISAPLEPPPTPAPAPSPLPTPTSAPPLIVTPPATTTTMGSGSESTTGGPGVQSATGSNVSVSLVRPPSVQEAGVVAVSVPREMATAGAGFSFPLPPQVAESATPNANVSVTTLSGGPLPPWLRFVQESRTFVASAVPDGAFPIQVIVTIGQTTTTIVISARTE